MRGPAPSRGSTEFPGVVQTGERRRSYLTAFPNCAKAQTDNPTALELEGDVPQKREESCQSSLWEDQKSPTTVEVDIMSEALEALIRLQEKCQAYPHPRRHPMTQNYSSSCPWGDDLQHAFIIE